MNPASIPSIQPGDSNLIGASRVSSSAVHEEGVLGAPSGQFETFTDRCRDNEFEEGSF